MLSSRACRCCNSVTTRQVEVLAAIYGLVSRWWATPGWRDRSLGDILNVAPTDVAETVMRMLGVTGFLPPAAEPEEE